MKGVCWGEWQELVQAQIRMFPSLLNVLERRGLVTRGEGLEEIRRLKEKAGEGAVETPQAPRVTPTPVRTAI